MEDPKSYQTSFLCLMYRKPDTEMLRFAAKSFFFPRQPSEETREQALALPPGRRGAGDTYGIKKPAGLRQREGGLEVVRQLIGGLCRHIGVTCFFVGCMFKNAGV